ncbi:hypothetical protein MJT46_012603 [Ovis ammon polii x Ovis aries]|nr:hypothetical protein MJT46_012603 [Ovis ammon polii x Ovis aries]
MDVVPQWLTKAGSDLLKCLALLSQSLSKEEEESSQSSSQTSDGSSPGKAPQRPHQGPDGSGSDPRGPPKSEGSNFYHYAALAVGSVPVVLGAMGFTGAGIAASSIAAKMMSAAAVANGGGVAAGSLVATLQSVDGKSNLCLRHRNYLEFSPDFQSCSKYHTLQTQHQWTRSRESGNTMTAFTSSRQLGDRTRSR